MEVVMSYPENTSLVHTGNGVDSAHMHEEALLKILAETYAKVGDDFFRSLVCHLAAALHVPYAFITECVDVPTTRVRTLAFWTGKDFGANFEYALAGTPCEDVVDGAMCYHPSNIQALFPRDQDLVTLGAESYLGVPLHSSSGAILGHLAVLDVHVMGDADRRKAILQIFAARASAELERKQATAALRESEERFRQMAEQTQEALRRSSQQYEIILAQEAALRELSTPLIPISERVVVMPLIGAIDTQRAHQVMETLLHGLANSRAEIAILDITGVLVVDTQVANALIAAAQAVKLLGATVLLTGIRPEVAQTLVGLGIDMRGIVTCGTLQNGIAHALGRR
jgi:anti-anti-sigma regulatory factor